MKVKGPEAEILGRTPEGVPVYPRDSKAKTRRKELLRVS